MQFQIIDIPIADLQRNTGQIPGVHKNPRIIKDNNFKKLQNSIEEDPDMLQLREILVYQYEGKNFIIGGNMRFEALKALKYETATVKLITDELNEATAAKLNRIILKDNSAYGEWDFDELANEWDSALLNACAIDIPTIDDPKLEEEAEEDNFDVDEAMTDEKEPTTQVGDVWQLGNHRLLCGDCTHADLVLTFMEGRHADLVLTDPPYNVNYEEKSRQIERYKKQGTQTRSDKQNKIENDHMSEPQFREFLSKAYNVMEEVCKPGGAVYVWHSMQYMQAFRDTAPKSFAWHDTLIWRKHHFCLTRKDYQLIYEPCLYYTKEGRGHYFCPKRNLADVIETSEALDIEKATKDELKNLLIKILQLPTTVIDCERPMKAKGHPTMKPVKLFGQQILNSSRVGEIVFDPFGGSGTTIVACEQLKRSAYVCELSPVYCDVIIKRWETLTGNQAVKLKNLLTTE